MTYSDDRRRDGRTDAREDGQSDRCGGGGGGGARESGDSGSGYRNPRNGRRQAGRQAAEEADRRQGGFLPAPAAGGRVAAEACRASVGCRGGTDGKANEMPV